MLYRVDQKDVPQIWESLLSRCATSMSLLLPMLTILNLYNNANTPDQGAHNIAPTDL